jgi:predicted phage-related endonuclease
MNINEMLGITSVRIGGSEIGCITGTNKHKSARRLYYEILGIVDKFQGNNKTRLGNVLEEPVLKEWFNNLETTQKELIPCDSKTYVDIQKNYKYNDVLTIGAQIDGLVELDGGLHTVEIKTTTGRGSVKNWEPPKSYIEQCCWGLHKALLLGFDVKSCYLVCLAIDQGYTIYQYEVLPNYDWFVGAVDLAVKFANNVIQETEPELIGCDDELEVLRNLDRHESIEPVYLPDIDQLIAQRANNNEIIHTLEKVNKSLDAQIIDALNGYEYGITDKYSVTLKKSIRQISAREASTLEVKTLRIKELK